MQHANSLTPAARYRWAVAARSLLAAFGGYLLAAACAACMSLAFQHTGMRRMDAVTAATMLSFVLYAAAALWVFATGTLRRACIGIALPTVMLTLAAWQLGGRP